MSVENEKVTLENNNIVFTATISRTHDDTAYFDIVGDWKILEFY